MNRIDEYWFWVSKAIVYPNLSNNFYYYNRLKDQLFGLNKVGKDLTPIFRNSYTKNKFEHFKEIDENIAEVLAKSSSLILLPKLSLNEKRRFLFEFASEIIDDNLKEKLIEEVNMLKASDEFNFKSDLKENKILSFDFGFKRGIFIAKKVREYFEPLGVSEKSMILW